MKTKILLEHAVNITAAPLYVFSRDDNGTLTLLCSYGTETYGASTLRSEIAAFLEQHATAPCPVIASIDSLLYYAVIPQKEITYLLGPVHLSAFLALKHNFKSDVPANLTDSNPTICDIPVFLNAVMLLHNMTAESPITERDLLLYNSPDKGYADVQKYNAALVFDNRENSQTHNSYSQELRLMGCIERGDLKMLEKCQQERITGSFGKLAHNMDRSVRNVCISVIALSSRAAIRGGVNSEIAFSLCDAYIMKIEALHDLRDLQPLVEGAQLNFASMVKRLKAETAQLTQNIRHPLIEKSKNYIQAHLHGKITVNEVAEKLRTNPNYLSSLFKRYEGISFSDFVMREKIALAKNLLIYSQSSYGEIAATLGFSSQSHMGKHFKQITGMTPIQFRKRYAITELSD